MNKKNLTVGYLFISLLGLTGISTLSTLVGCSSAPTVPAELDPAVLYKEAEEDFKHEHFQIALEKFRTVKNRHPYSHYAVDAALRIGDVLYEQETFADAAIAYESFRDLHPKHPKTSYAVYRIAKSYLSDTPSPISRDLTSAQKAIDAYNEMLRRYPDAPEAATAKKELSEARNLLAEKEVYIGNFYFRAKSFEAAKPRYEKVVQLYSDTASLKDAEEMLKKISQLESK